MKYVELVHEIGSFGYFQKRLILLTFLATVPNAFVSVMFIFTNRTPEFRCKEYGDERQIRTPNLTRTLNEASCHSLNNYSDISYSSATASSCVAGWIYEDNNSVIAEFDLVCENAWKGALVMSVHMTGKLIAGFSGKISDRFGRRPVFLLSTLGQFLLMGITSFAWSYETYILGLLLVTYSSMMNYVSAYVVATEMIDCKRRKQVAMITFLGYAVGYMVLPALAYAFPYWRWYMRANLFIGALYIPYYWIYPESLRWLLVSGRTNEAKKLASLIAKMNKKSIDIEKSFENTKDLINDAKVTGTKVKELNLERIDVKAESSLLYVLKNQTMRCRYVSLWFVWFSTVVVYYSISLYPTYLSGNVYINTFLAGLVEVPGNVCAFLLWKLIGGTRTLFLCLLTAGLCCCISPFTVSVSSGLTTAVVMLGKLTVTGVFTTVYMQTTDITPTLVRNTSMGLASAIARIGGIVMPYIMLAGQLDDGNRFIPYLIMGALALISALLCIMVLPETIGIPMPDTVEEAISNKRVYKLNPCRKFGNADSCQEIGRTDIGV